MSASREVPEMATIHDAVHGPISLAGWEDPSSDTLLRMSRSRELERLRGIKQLSFASYAFPAADHSRHAHALGTMHVMRCLLEARGEQVVGGVDLDSMAKTFRGFMELGSNDDERRRLLGQHLLIAALVQDVGELPFEQATSRLMMPSPQIEAEVRNRLGGHPQMTSNKALFTMACLCGSEILSEAPDIDLSLLAFLATGYAGARQDAELPDGLRALRYLLDGAIDADRLDYVFRDAHHTIGHIGGPAGVVDSLHDLDDEGPIFAEPGPVLDFLATRASLWSRVYFSPQNRFRQTLLRTICQFVQLARLYKDFLDREWEGFLTYDDFSQTDDMTIVHGLQRLSESGKAARNLEWIGHSQSAKVALELLQPDRRSYEAVWLPAEDDGSGAKEEVPLPGDFFFDAYADYRSHHLYEPGAVRLAGTRYRYAGERPVPLESCAGPLSSMLETAWSALGPQDGVLVFLPDSRQGRAWEEIEKRIKDGGLQRQLAYSDSALRSRVHDTRRDPGAVGPNIFISYAFDDRDFVERVVAILRHQRRRFFFWATPLDGYAPTAQENSVAGVEESDVTLIVLSSIYLEQHNDAKGNIAREVRAMCRGVREGNLIVRPLSLEPQGVTKKALPWDELGLSGDPLANSLAEADAEALRNTVIRTLTDVDRVYRAP